MSRTPFIAGNWKMNKTIAEAEAFIQALLPRVSTTDGVDVAVCVPFTDLQAVVDSTRGSRVEVYAQNMHQAPSGAFTGEVSAPMLAELDVHGVVLGHSERRQLYNETDRALSEKVPAALDAGLKPILCVGETEDEREAGDTERKLRHQVQEGLEKLDSARLGDVVIAYEPIWAIGTGLVATPEQAQDAIAFVRALVADRDRERSGRRRPARERRAPARWCGPVGLPRRPRRLGDRAARPGQRRLAGDDAGLRRPLAALSAQPADDVGHGGGPPRAPDGQLRGRAPQPRRRRSRQAGPHAHRRGRRGRD